MPRRLAAGAPRTPTRHESSAPHSAGRSAVSPCRGAACTRPGRRGRRTRYSHWSSAQPKERSGEPTNGISCGRARKLGRDGCAVPLNWPTEALSHAKFSMHSYVSPRGRGIHALTPQHCARRSRPPGPPQPCGYSRSAARRVVRTGRASGRRRAAPCGASAACWASVMSSGVADTVWLTRTVGGRRMTYRMPPHALHPVQNGSRGSNEVQDGLPERFVALPGTR